MNNKVIKFHERIGGDTHILLAAEKNDKRTVELLISNKADINCSHGCNNWTVLHYAAKNGWNDVVQSLLNKGADIQGGGPPPLLLAAENCHKDIVELLINAGADINCSHGCNNWTVLHYASKNGWCEIVQSLLNKGADIQGGVSPPLLLAAEYHHKDVVELLINAGADITSLWRKNYTVLHYASENGWAEIVQTLLKKSADINLKTVSGCTPLYLAALRCEKGIVELLINAGADINCSCGLFNYTVLHEAAYYGWFAIVQILLNKGADINAKTKQNGSPLLFAAENDRSDVVELLVNAGADVNIKNDNGDSPLSYILLSCDSSYVKLAGLIIKSGAYVEPDDYEVINSDSELKEHILQDIELCTQAIINEFNHKDLPEIYKLSRQILPAIENMKIGKKSQAAHEVLQSVEKDIQVKGHCNVLEIRPIVLKILSVKSFLTYCDSIKNQGSVSNQMKRSADIDNVVDLRMPASKVRRLDL